MVMMIRCSSFAMDILAWRGLLYTVFILHFVFLCQLLLLQPLVSAIGTLRSLSFPISCIDLIICAKFLIFVSWVLSLLSLELNVSCFVVVI